MAAEAEQSLWCSAGVGAGRRFYVHERSFGAVLSAQPGFRAELVRALLLAAASRGVDQQHEDAVLLGGGAGDDHLSDAAKHVHHVAAEALQETFQLMVHLVPESNGETRFLLSVGEGLSAWCYEDGYFTYATDEESSRVMYEETGSLRDLRSRIRRAPDHDPSLQMISGPGLFLLDRNFGVGTDTAGAYRGQARRLLRRPDAVDGFLGYGQEDVLAEVSAVLSPIVGERDARDLAGGGRRHVSMTESVLRRSVGQGASR